MIPGPLPNHRGLTASQLSKTNRNQCPLEGTTINRAPTFLHNQECGNGKNRGLYVRLWLGLTWLPSTLMWKRHHLPDRAPRTGVGKCGFEARLHRPPGCDVERTMFPPQCQGKCEFQLFRQRECRRHDQKVAPDARARRMLFARCAGIRGGVIRDDQALKGRQNPRGT
jgi:hypothetical protein